MEVGAVHGGLGVVHVRLDVGHVDVSVLISQRALVLHVVVLVREDRIDKGADGQAETGGNFVVLHRVEVSDDDDLAFLVVLADAGNDGIEVLGEQTERVDLAFCQCAVEGDVFDDTRDVQRQCGRHAVGEGLGGVECGHRGVIDADLDSDEVGRSDGSFDDVTVFLDSVPVDVALVIVDRGQTVAGHAVSGEAAVEKDTQVGGAVSAVGELVDLCSLGVPDDVGERTFDRRPGEFLVTVVGIITGQSVTGRNAVAEAGVDVLLAFLAGSECRGAQQDDHHGDGGQGEQDLFDVFHVKSPFSFA